MPKVTALMPLYNSREFVRASLESVRKQTFTDWELIIVSSDSGCADAAAKYAANDARIRLVRLQERMSSGATLNAGLDAAMGQYIVRIDAGAVSEPERFARQVSYMEQHPEVSMCCCRQISGKKKAEQTEGSELWIEDLKVAMLFGFDIESYGVMLRKEDMDAHGWRYDASCLDEGYELYTRMLGEGAVMAGVPDALVRAYANTAAAETEKTNTAMCLSSMRLLASLGVGSDRYNRSLFSPWQALPKRVMGKNRTLFLYQGFRLIQEMIEKNQTAAYCAPEALRKAMLRRWDLIRESCGLEFKKHAYDRTAAANAAPLISVVLPTYNSAADISKAIDCVLDQTLEDWELLVVNDLNSNDGTAEIVQMYGLGDGRIRLIQAEERLGLAASLNLGLREARGKYIARLDADDTSAPERFERQAAYLDEHPEVGICGAWQHHVGKGIDWVHQAAPEPEVQRCRLLFWCDLCHSTLMLRRDMFIENELFYDPEAQAEDYELWTRAMEHMQIANIPEVLGEYSEGTGITANKIQALAVESGKITAHILKRILQIDVADEDCCLLNGWVNPLSHADSARADEMERLKRIFLQIWEQNRKIGFFDDANLLQVLAAKWHWTKRDVDWRSANYKGVRRIEDVFNDEFRPSLFERYKDFRKNNPRLSVRLRKIVRRYVIQPPARLVRSMVASAFRGVTDKINRDIEHWTWDRVYHINKSIEMWTQERYQQLRDDMDQALDEGLRLATEELTYAVDGHMQRTEKDILRALDERVWKAEENLSKTIDGRVWKAEENLSQAIDGRVWKAEENLSKAVDGRVWKAEENLSKAVDGRVWKAEENILQTVDGRIWKAEENIVRIGKNIEQYSASMMTAMVREKVVFLIGTPEHDNIGDAAIVAGEMEFIRRYFPEYRLIEVPFDDLDIWYEVLRTQIRSGDMICLQGGGNMGSKYLHEEAVRRRVVSDFPDVPVTILPQTAFYDDSEAGQKELAHTAEVFGKHPDLTIMARGRQSLKLMRTYFPAAKSVCIPDMALLLEKEYGLERKGILLCIRALNDESGLTGAQYEDIFATVRRMDTEADITDNLYEGPIYRSMRRGVIDEQLRRFASRQVVVTDRLHGLIFALITHTPCVVLSSYNYKIGEFIKTFVDSDGVCFLNSDPSQLESSIRKAMEHGPLSETGVDMGLFELARRMMNRDE